MLNPQTPYGAATRRQIHKQVDGNLVDIVEKSRFAYPPATEEQLQATEDILGFSLPGTLRRLYAEVANGGFGPGYGILGAVGGTSHASNWYTNIAQAYWERPSHVQLVDFATLNEAQVPDRWFHLAYEEPEGLDLEASRYQWPEYLLQFCYWGCNTSHALHAKTGQIYVVESGFDFALWVPSLEEWLERWLYGTLRQQ
jgi:hypothetical protein